MTEQAKPNEQAEESKYDNSSAQHPHNEHADTVELSGEQAIISKLETVC
jgi:molecular chaperone GrpE